MPPLVSVPKPAQRAIVSVSYLRWLAGSSWWIILLVWAQGTDLVDQNALTHKHKHTYTNQTHIHTTHLHANIHACAHIHMHMCGHTCMCIHVCTHNADRHTPVGAHTCIHTHVHTHSCMFAHTRACAHRQAPLHVHACTPRHTHPHIDLMLFPFYLSYLNFFLCSQFFISHLPFSIPNIETLWKLLHRSSLLRMWYFTWQALDFTFCKIIEQSSAPGMEVFITCLSRRNIKSSQLNPQEARVTLVWLSHSAVHVVISEGHGTESFTPPSPL